MAWNLIGLLWCRVSAVLLGRHQTFQSAIYTRALGYKTSLVQGNLERIQGRTLGCLRIRVEAPASAFEQLLEQARQVADRAEPVSPGRNAPAAFPVAG